MRWTCLKRGGACGGALICRYARLPLGGVPAAWGREGASPKWAPDAVPAGESGHPRDFPLSGPRSLSMPPLPPFEWKDICEMGVRGARPAPHPIGRPHKISPYDNVEAACPSQRSDKILKQNLLVVPPLPPPLMQICSYCQSSPKSLIFYPPFTLARLHTSTL